MKAEDETRCYGCDRVIDDGDAVEEAGDTYCEDCYHDRFEFSCYRCGDSCRNDDREEYDGEYYCSDYCAERDGRGSEDEDEIPERDYSEKNLPEFQSNFKGDIITSQRMFSAEVECYYGSEEDIQRAGRELHTAFGISGDGSLEGNGVEFQTPKLRGKRGEDAIKTLCKAIEGFTTDKSTGLHIHLDGQGLLPKDRTKTEPIVAKEVLRFYIAMEEVIMSFLPPSRRRNSYALSMRNLYRVDEVNEVWTLEALEKMWYRASKRADLKRRKAGKYDSSRYAGINFHSLLKDGHLEVRYHSGTTNPVKILEWVNLHQTILDACTPAREHYARRIGTVAVESVSRMVELREKTELFFELLQLPPRARAYFMGRQATFTSSAVNNGEAESLNEVCAG